MRQVGLVAFALGLLTLEGALGRLLHLEVLRPDPVLMLVVLVAFRHEPNAPITVFAMGILADAFGGMPTGMLTMIYLLIWVLVRWAQIFFIPDRQLVRLGTLFGTSLVCDLLLIALLPSLSQGADSVSTIGVWMLPLALINTVLAGFVWAPARRILGGAQRALHFELRG